jgi:hypothetical protein
MNSNLVGCSIAHSDGLARHKIQSTAGRSIVLEGWDMPAVQVSHHIASASFASLVHSAESCSHSSF